MFSHIKDTDLNFAGISMKFASLGGIPRRTVGDGVSDGYYDRPEAHVPLADGKTLHAVIGGSNEIKLTLVDSTGSCGTKGKELEWVSVGTMRSAVNDGFLHVSGKTLAFAAIPRQLKRMLAMAS